MFIVNVFYRKRRLIDHLLTCGYNKEARSPQMFLFLSASLFANDGNDSTLLNDERAAVTHQRDIVLDQCLSARDRYLDALSGWAETEFIIIHTDDAHADLRERLRALRDGYASQVAVADDQAREVGIYPMLYELMLDSIERQSLGLPPNNGRMPLLTPIPSQVPTSSELSIVVDLPMSFHLSLDFQDCFPDLYRDWRS